MDNQLKQYKDMLFDYQTTLRTDFVEEGLHSDWRNYYKSVYRPPPPPKQKPYEPLKDYRTMHEIKEGAYIPFTLFYKDKDIIRTDPRTIMEEKPIDCKERTKVRVSLEYYPPPFIAVQRVDDKSRDLIIREHYKTTSAVANESLKSQMCSTLKSPLPDVYAPTNTITIEPWVPALVSPEWRMQSVSWDRKANRDYICPSKTFWLSRKPKVAELKPVKRTLVYKKLKTKK